MHQAAAVAVAAVAAVAALQASHHIMRRHLIGYWQGIQMSHFLRQG